MTLDRFLSEGEPTWAELESLVKAAGTRPASLGSRRLLRLGALYRAAASDLAQARHRFRGDPVVDRLERLVGRARALVYTRSRRRRSLVEFYSTRYWELIVERRRLLALAAGALLVPILIGFLYASANGEQVRQLVPSAFLWVTEERPAGTDLGLTRAELTAFSFQVLVNNIQVTVTAFAVGIALGLVTFGLIAYNGLIFGILTALAIDAGNGALLVEAVMAHGVLELSCIVIGGVAGFRLAAAVVNPGQRPRRVAVVEEAGPAALLALGTAPFLILAGFIEGFVSRTGTTAVPATIIGFVVGGAFWVTAVVRGTAQNRTRDLAIR